MRVFIKVPVISNKLLKMFEKEYFVLRNKIDYLDSFSESFLRFLRLRKEQLPLGGAAEEVETDWEEEG